MTHLLQILDPVVDCILHNRLDDELDRRQILHTLFQGDGELKLVLVADLLDDQVVADMLKLLGKGDDVPTLADGDSEELCQGGDHLDHSLGIVLLCHPDYRIEGVVQEVWVDFCLQCIKFELAFHLLAGDNIIHQLPDAFDHHCKGLGQGSNLLVASHCRRSGEVSAFHAVHQSVELPDRAAYVRRNHTCQNNGDDDAESQDDKHDGGVLIKSGHQLVHECHPDDSPTCVVDRIDDDKSLPSLEGVGERTENILLGGVEVLVEQIGVDQLLVWVVHDLAVVVDEIYVPCRPKLRVLAQFTDRPEVHVDQQKTLAQLPLLIGIADLLAVCDDPRIA